MFEQGIIITFWRDDPRERLGELTLQTAKKVPDTDNRFLVTLIRGERQDHFELPDSVVKYIAKDPEGTEYLATPRTDISAEGIYGFEMEPA